MARNSRERLALLRRIVQLVALSAAVLIPALLLALPHLLWGNRTRAHRRLFRRVTTLLMLLGPAFVKAGQVLGTRRDILPPALCDELSVLQDSVRPMTAEQARQAVRAAYGTDPSQIFAELDYEPVASGSVAGVYRGKLRSGKEVAVKIRRPGIDHVMNVDLGLMRRGAALAAKLPVFRGVPVTELIGQMCDAVLGQLDFRREADSLHRLRANLSAVPRVWVPKVYPDECRGSCIVMEFIPGLDLGVTDRTSPAVNKRFASSALTSIYQMLFVDGFVHCDMHPGNLYFTSSAQVVVLDAGFSVQLSDRLRRLFAEFFLNMSLGRGERCAQIVIESAAGLKPDADVDGFLERMGALVERNHGLPAKEFSLIGFATEMFDLQRGCGVHAAPELIFPLLSLLVIEGTIRRLDPDIDFQQTARPVLSKGVFGTTRTA